MATSTKTVVQDVARQMDGDRLERRRRRLNCCVLRVPESNAKTAKLREDADLKFCVETLDISKSDITSVHRAGKKDEKKADYRRPLILKMKDEQAVDYWTYSGRGYHVNVAPKVDYYVNPDLCKADRDANFLARKEKTERQKQWEKKNKEAEGRTAAEDEKRK